MGQGTNQLITNGYHLLPINTGFLLRKQVDSDPDQGQWHFNLLSVLIEIILY